MSCLWIESCKMWFWLVRITIAELFNYIFASNNEFDYTVYIMIFQPCKDLKNTSSNFILNVIILDIFNLKLTSTNIILTSQNVMASCNYRLE